MAAPAEPASDSGDADVTIDAQAFRGRVEKLLELCANLRDSSYLSSSESKRYLAECVADLKTRSEEIDSEPFGQYLSGIEDIGVYLDYKKKELERIRAENFSLCNEVSLLATTFDQDFFQFQSELAHFGSLLDDGDSKVSATSLFNKAGEMLSTNLLGRLDREDSLLMRENCHFEVLGLEGLIEKRKLELDCIEDLESILKRVEAISQIEEVLCDSKVIEFKDNCIRLSLKTFLPMTGFLVYQFASHKMSEPSVVDHEMLIEVISATKEINDVEIFPNDIPINDIVNDAKSARKDVSCSTSFSKMRSPLGWLVRKVQQRILLCTLRRLALKDANRSSYKFECSDIDGTITAHLAGGIVASIMVPESWPIRSALRLLALKNMDFHSKEVSVSFLHKVEELANSLDIERRYNLLYFVEAIEEIIKQQMELDNL